jgi:hypothetical protein
MFNVLGGAVPAYGASTQDHAELTPQTPCCSSLHVIATPNRGVFGHPAANILGEYTFTGSVAHQHCADCKEPARLRETLEAFMGGRRWSFLTEGRQYAAFASNAATCPEQVDSWKRVATPQPRTALCARAARCAVHPPHALSWHCGRYWRVNKYVEGRFLLRCGAVAR